MKTRNFSFPMGILFLLQMLIYLFGFSLPSGIGQIAEWTFENITSSVPSLPISASSKIPQVSASASLSGGNNNGSPDACSGNETWSTNFWPTGNSRLDSEYLEFSVRADPGEYIDINYFSFSSSASSSNSALSFEVYYSKNNFSTSSFLFSGTHSINGCSSHGSGLDATLLPGSRIKFRIYFFGQNVAAQAATIRLDNVSISGAVLPVELVSFSATPKQGKVLLKWITSTEVNNDYFAIERSRNGVSFLEIGQVPGSGTRQTEQVYHFVDDPMQSGIYYYRLRQVDFDGTANLHPLIVIDLSKKDPIGIRIWPTVAHEYLQIQVDGDEEGLISVRNINGLILRQIKCSGTTRSHQLKVADLPKGWYVLQYESGQQRQNFRFVKQ